MIPDEPILSLRRVLLALRRWAWFICEEPPVYISFWRMVFYEGRPYACHLHDERVKRRKQRMWNDINPNKLPLVEWLEGQGGKWARLAELLDTHRRQTNLLREAREVLDRWTGDEQTADLVARIDDELAKE